MNTSLRSRSELTFEDVLRSLSIYAKDTLVADLQRYGCLHAARLAFRALRETVDNSVKVLRLTIKPEDSDLWRDGQAQRLSLHRWPRCSKLSIYLDERLDEELQTGELLAAPLLYAPINARQRIQELSLDMAHTDEHGFYVPSLAVSALLHRLPGLRCVRLYSYLPEDPLQPRILVDALSSLPHLEDLQIRSDRFLDHIGELADKLRYLTVFGSHGHVPALDASMVAGVARLHKLKKLCVMLISGGNEQADRDSQADVLRMLLDSAPQSLEILQVPSCSLLEPNEEARFDAEFRLSAGRVVSLTADTDVPLRSLSHFSQKVFFPSRAVSLGPSRGKGLERLELCGLTGNLDFLQDPDSVPVDTMLQLCECVRVGALHLHGAIGLQNAALVRLISALQKPCVLRIGTPPGPLPSVRLRSEGQAPAALDGGSERLPPTGAYAAASAFPGTLVRLAMQHLMVGPVAEASGAGSAVAAAAAAGPDGTAEASSPPALNWIAPADGAGSTSDCAYLRKRLLLLRGPLISVLSRTEVALRAWVEQLLRDAQRDAELAAAAAGARMPLEPEPVRHVGHYLPLPRITPGVLVECGSVFGEESVVAVAQRALSFLGAPADATVDADFSASYSWGAEALQVVALPPADRLLDKEASVGNVLMPALVGALEKVLQAVWDGTDGAAAPGGGPASEAQRLERLLQLWRQAGELGEVTRL